MDKGARQAIVHWVARVRHDLLTKPPPRIMFVLYKNVAKRNVKKLFKSE